MDPQKLQNLAPKEVVQKLPIGENQKLTKEKVSRLAPNIKTYKVEKRNNLGTNYKKLTNYKNEIIKQNVNNRKLFTERSMDIKSENDIFEKEVDKLNKLTLLNVGARVELLDIHQQILDFDVKTNVFNIYIYIYL